MDTPVLIFRFQGRKNQLREQIEAVNVRTRESPWSSRHNLQHAKGLATPAERNQHSRTGSRLASEVELETLVEIAIVRADRAAGFETIPQEHRFAGEWSIAQGGHRTRCSAAEYS